MSKRFIDILNGKTEEVKTGEEIAADLIERCGLTVISNEEANDEFI